MKRRLGPKVKREVPRTVPVKLHDGPCRGMIVQVAAGKAVVSYASLLYSDTNTRTEDGTRVFARHPRARFQRALLMRLIGATGKDPRLMRVAPKPHVGRRVKVTSSMRRAEARKLRAAQAAWRASDGYNGR